MPKDQLVYERIFQAIVEQRLPPGTKLGEEALCEAFGVSRPRIRKVLQRLVHDSLITLQPNRGAFVAQPSVREAREVFAARRLIEPPLATALAGHVGADDLDELRAFVTREGEAQAGGARQRAIRLSGEFHLRLANLAGNEVVAKFLRQLVSRTSLIIAMYESPGATGCSAPHHGELLDLIAEGDGERAAEAMAQHLEAIERSLRLEAREAKAVDLAMIFAADEAEGLAEAS